MNIHMILPTPWCSAAQPRETHWLCFTYPPRFSHINSSYSSYLVDENTQLSFQPNWLYSALQQKSGPPRQDCVEWMNLITPGLEKESFRFSSAETQSNSFQVGGNAVMSWYYFPSPKSKLLKTIFSNTVNNLASSFSIEKEILLIYKTHKYINRLTYEDSLSMSLVIWHILVALNLCWYAFWNTGKFCRCGFPS